MRKPRHGIAERVAGFVKDWSLPRQVDRRGPSQSKAAESTMSRTLRPRLEEADTVGTSICPYCAVGCAQLVYAKNGQTSSTSRATRAARSTRARSAPRARRPSAG